MKLAKALKLKNQVAGEVARLKDLLTKQNVRSTKQPFDYNNADVLVSLRGKIDELVKIKAAIAAANAEVYGKIFRMAELKGLITTLSALETRHGVFYERGSGYGDHQPVAVEYAAQLKAVEVDKLVAELKAEIQSLQDSLDEFNYTHSAAL
ncbi:MAG: hypothetical protein WA117_13970 [Verrucomicrobiia bacterium]